MPRDPRGNFQVTPCPRNLGRSAALLGHGESILTRVIAIQSLGRADERLMLEDPDLVRIFDETQRPIVETAVDRVTDTLMRLHHDALKATQN